MRKTLSIFSILAGLILTTSVVALANTTGNETVKVKVVKIVDGDTTVIEKTLDESAVADFTKQFQNIKGKNVQVMITVENPKSEKGQATTRHPQMLQFDLNIDSAMGQAFSKCFIMKDSIHCGKFEWNDSLMQKCMKGFNFQFSPMGEDFMKDMKFDFDIQAGEDGKSVILKSANGKTIVINTEEEGEKKESGEDGTTRTTTKTIIVNDDQTQKKKKVIVTTSVTVIDMEDEKGTDSKNERGKAKDASNMKFYPNPSDGNFTLELDLDGRTPAVITIRDVNGKEVYRDKINGSGHVTRNLNLEGKKGTFIVTIEQGKKNINKKIIIE